MHTFKQFLAELNALEHISVEMFFRGVHGFTAQEAKDAVQWVLDPDSIIHGSDVGIWIRLYTAFGAEMPYDVAKAEGDVSPEQWIYDAIVTQIEHHCGLKPEDLTQ